MASYRLQVAFAVALFLPAVLPADPYLVKDLNPGPSAVPLNLYSLYELVLGPDGVSYFSATDPAHGNELWRSDGTPAGTHRVTDICAGRCSSAPTFLRIVRGQIFFSADDGFSGNELWVTDGTPGGERRVRDLCAGPCSSSPIPAGEAGGGFLFVASNGRRLQLWKTDGTRDGTVLLKLLCASDDAFYCDPYLYSRSAGERAIFFDTSDPERRELWVTDGTVAGTRPFEEAFGGELDPQDSDVALVQGPGFAWVWTGTGLWRTDGTAAGTHRLKTASELVHDPEATHELAYRTIVWNGLFIGVLGDGALIRSDGTPEGTYRIAKFPTWAVTHFVALDDKILFTVDLGTSPSSVSLWSSRGTADTTIRVIDLESSTLFSDVGFVNLGDRAVFSQGFPLALWVTDGTAAGTRKLSFPVSPYYNGVSGFVSAGRQAYFARDGGKGTADDLWISDGSEAGTRRVKDFHAAPGSSGPLAQTIVGNRLLFSAQTGSLEAPLFLTDGTAVGTRVVSTDASWASDFIRLGDRLLFSAAEWSDDGYSYSQGVWQTNGTAAGTSRVAPQFFDLHNAMVFGGSLFFPHVEDGSNVELWKNDGTARGTVLVKDIDPYLKPAPHHLCALEGSHPRPALVLRNRLLLTADDGKHGRELWTTDGTPQGTRLLLDVNPLRSPEPPPSCDDDRKPRKDTGLSSNPKGFAVLGDIALFSAVDGRTGRELWRTDGTPQRTRRVVDLRPGPRGSVPHDLIAFQDRIYFFAASAGPGEELWRTDGTARGTELVLDLALEGLPSWGRDLVVAGDRLFFVVYNETTGAELWVSGGDAASTVLVGDLNPGPANAAPRSLTNVDGILAFAADDGLTGLEPWRSDGTPAGTFKLIDLAPGPDSSSPGPFTRVRQVLITGANDGAHGREPWALPLDDILPP